MSVTHPLLDAELLDALDRRLHPIGPRPTAASAGEASSHRAGRGGGFFEHREHRPGDDPARIDWRVSARLGRAVTRVDRAEAESRVTLCLDRSPTMRFHGWRPRRGASAEVGGGVGVAMSCDRWRGKWGRVLRLAAAMAWVVVRRGGRVGVVWTDPDRVAPTAVPVGGGWPHLMALLDRLQTIVPAQTASVEPGHTLAEALHAVDATQACVVLSDVYPDPEPIIAALGRRTAADATVVQVWHPDEADLPSGPARLRDLCHPGPTRAIDAQDRRSHRAGLARHLDAWDRAARRAGVNRLVSGIDTPPLDTLERWLHRWQATSPT